MLLPVETGEATVLAAEFKLGLNTYLKKPVASPVRSLAEVIARNKKLDIVGLYMSMNCSHYHSYCIFQFFAP